MAEEVRVVLCISRQKIVGKLKAKMLGNWLSLTAIGALNFQESRGFTDILICFKKGLNNQRSF
jgi:hypothetical protein